MKLLLDELYPQAIAEELRKRGFDVVSVHEISGLEGLADEQVLERATEEGRAVVTENTADFVPIVQRWMAESRGHGGLLLTSPVSLPRSRQTIGRYVRALEDFLAMHPGATPLRDQVRWVPPR